LVIVDYRSASARKFPKRAVAVPVALNVLCLLALFVLPVALLSTTPVMSFLVSAPVFAILLFMAMRSAIKLRALLIGDGYRFASLALVVSPMLLAVPALAESCVLIPLLNNHFRENRIWRDGRRRERAFENAVVVCCSEFLTRGEYPADLRIMVAEWDLHTSLEDRFPDATVTQLEDMRRLAVELRTRPPSAVEEKFIEAAGHFAYYGQGLKEANASKDVLVFASHSMAGGDRLLGFSSGRTERISSAALSAAIVKCNGDRVASGLPPIVLPP